MRTHNLSAWGKESAWNARDWGSVLELGRSPGGDVANHSSILAWIIPWTEQPAGYSLWAHKELDVTRVTNTFLSSIEIRIYLYLSIFKSFRIFKSILLVWCNSQPKSFLMFILYSHSETSTISMLDLHLLFLTAVTLPFAFQSFASSYTFWAVLCGLFPGAMFTCT